MKGEAGLPYTGVATFARAPLVARHGEWSADAAVLGVPYDWGVGYRPGARVAPRAIRDASTRYALPSEGFWDVETGLHRLRGLRLVDAGDVDVVYLDTEESFARIAEGVRAIVRRGALPVVLGGDHSITFPSIAGLREAFGEGGRFRGARLHILQFDAHLDFRDELLGVRLANSSPIRRATELPFVGRVLNVGVRGLRTAPGDFAAARERGATIVLARDVHEAVRRGGHPALAALAEALPAGEPVYVTIDIDGLDAALCPGTGSPEPDGLTYAEVKTLLRAVGDRMPIVGIDLVEVNPLLDPSGRTALVAAELLLEAISAAWDGRRGRGATGGPVPA
ncbi:MAG: agmatinase [Clostridia bacterium]|nr:agmatinase [Clostridia bacterium]